MTERTAAEHRAKVDAWRATAPEHDHEIIPPPPRYSDEPRHEEDLADELRPLLIWKRLAKAEDPLRTNWLTADNDNEAASTQGRSIERTWEIRPNESELEASYRNVELTTLPDGRVIPTGGDVEYD